MRNWNFFKFPCFHILSHWENFLLGRVYALGRGGKDREINKEKWGINNIFLPLVFGTYSYVLYFVVLFVFSKNFQLLAKMFNFTFIEITWKLGYLRCLNFIQEKWLRGHTLCLHAKWLVFWGSSEKLFLQKCEL